MAQSLILGHNKTFHKRVIQNVKKIIQDTQIGNSLADCKQFFICLDKVLLLIYSLNILD